MKIVQVMTRPNVGGIATQVFGYCEGLTAAGHEVTLVTGRVGPHEADAFEVVGRPACRIEVLPDLGREVAVSDARAIVAMTRLLRQMRPDVVHTHAAKAGTVGRVAARLAGVPIRVHSFHGHVFRGYFSPMVSRVVAAIERGLGLMSSAVLVPGESQAVEIADRYRIVPRRKIRVVPYGVPISTGGPTRAAARAHFGLTASKVIGAVGRMAPIKNQDLLLDAFILLRAQPAGADTQLLIVGDGECRDGLEQRVRAAGLADAVKLFRWEPDLAATYAAMDVLAISSRNEGMPVTALEAMAAGVPVASTAVGGVVDLVRPGETGWLVPADATPQQFADMLAGVLESPDVAAVAGRARTYIDTHHSFAAACAGLTRVYLED
ncbi:MAG: glycosyltransferase family 4 protein [Acidimicrobiia bacterium]|nr:glycosyltransferase family 4 protein [Acidimicrobiia bacterium]